MKETVFDSRKKSAFRLRKLQNGKYQIHKNRGKAFEGPRRLILRAAFEMGVNPADFRVAVKEMRKMNHDCAEFGVFGKFLFTRQDRRAA